jgi:hypothetical protein
MRKSLERLQESAQENPDGGAGHDAQFFGQGAVAIEEAKESGGRVFLEEVPEELVAGV